MTELKGGYPVSAEDMRDQFGIEVREADDGEIMVTTEPRAGVSGESWVRKGKGWTDVYREGVVEGQSSAGVYQRDILDAFYG